jgi:hypothetical protein
VTAVVLLVCLLALLAPHISGHGALGACVLFFPVFLFGLLDLELLLRNAVRADESFLPQAPVLIPLFQRPPPAFD